MIGIAQRTLHTPFDYYVDSVGGNDGRAGTSLGAAFASFAPLASLPVRSGIRVGLAGGSLWRTSLVVPQPGMTFGPYGSGAAPQISNSVPFSSATWASVAGAEYKLASGSTVGPNPGGATPAIFWVDTSVTPNVVTALFKGTAGALTANQWAIASNFLNVNIGRSPVATDRFEVGQGYGVQIEKSNTRISGLYAAFNGNYNIAANTVSPVDNVQIDNCELAFTSADNCNINNGAGTNIRFLYNYSHDSFNDGGGGGDGFSAHGACSGVVAYNTFRRNGKNGIANSEKGTWDYRGNKFDASNFAVYGDGGGGSIHRAWGNTFVNEKPQLSAGEARIYIGALTATVQLYNNSVAKGTGAGNERGIRVDGGTATARNNVVWGAGATPFSIGLYQAGGALTESNNAAGGSSADRITWGSTSPITISSDPFTSVATGNLAPGVSSPLLAAGVAVTNFTNGSPPDVGYTGAAP